MSNNAYVRPTHPHRSDRWDLSGVAGCGVGMNYASSATRKVLRCACTADIRKWTYPFHLTRPPTHPNLTAVVGGATRRCLRSFGGCAAPHLQRVTFAAGPAGVQQADKGRSCFCSAALRRRRQSQQRRSVSTGSGRTCPGARIGIWPHRFRVRRGVTFRVLLSLIMR